MLAISELEKKQEKKKTCKQVYSSYKSYLLLKVFEKQEL